MEENKYSSLTWEEKENLKNEKLKSMISVFSMMIITVGCLVLSSYSFFYKESDSVNVKVGVSNGIQISVDAKTWKTSINNSDIINNAYKGNKNQLPGELSAVSSAGEVDVSTGFMKMFKSLLKVDGNASSGYRIEAERSYEDSGNTGDFVAFDIFVLSNEDGAVYLSNNSDVISKENTCASNAVRVAFLYQGVSQNSTEAIKLKGASSYNEDSQDSNIIWEPNNIKESSYYAVNQDINGNENVEYKSKNDAFTLITPSIQTPESNSVNGSSKTLFNLKKGINKIRIYAWIEGQDSDCYNNITASDIMYNIQISKEA